MKKWISLTCFILACLATPAWAADVTLIRTDAFNESSFNSGLGWSNGLAPSTENNYIVPPGLWRLRTPEGSTASFTFAGNSLKIQGGAWEAANNNYGFVYKGADTAGTSAITVSNLILDGGQIVHLNGNTHFFNLYGSLNVISDSYIYAKQGPIHIYAPISGSGMITNPGSDVSTNILFIRSADNTYTGSIVNNGRLELADGGVLNFVIGDSGVNNNVSGTGPATVFNGVFKFDLTGAATALGSSWTIASAAGQTFGATFSVADAYDLGNNTWAVFANNAIYQFSETTGVLSVVERVTLPPHNPSPADQAASVPTSTFMLSWTGSKLPNGSVDPNVVKYYVWTNENNLPESTLTYMYEVPAGTSADASAVIGPLSNNYTYYWQVEQVMKKTSGTYSPGDPNNVLGPVWSFATPITVPVITAQPQNAKAYADGTETVEFTVTYTSDVPVIGATWYKDGGALPATNVVWDQTSSTLTVPNVIAADLGSYHCEVATGGGGLTSSQAALLSEKKILAWYQFENNLEDSAGTNHATLVGPAGGLLYTEFVIPDTTPGKIPGQTYAADPNGAVHGLLTTEAYPKAGFGNGLDEGTISYWVKLAPDTFGTILGNYNGTPGTTEGKTGIRTRVDNNGFVRIHVRDEDASQGEPISTTAVDDNNWHLVVAVFTSSRVTLYVNVMDEQSRTPSTPIDNFGAWQYPLVLLANNNRTAIQDMFPGMIDDLKIYNYAMTREDVAELYHDITGKSSCLYPVDARLDFNNDCKIDMADFARIAEAWLVNGLYPN
jgi:hypothetical protein